MKTLESDLLLDQLIQGTPTLQDLNWKKDIVPVLKEKIKSLFKEPHVSEFHQLIESRDASPFTLQRIAELLKEPHLYSNPDKFAHALDKCLRVQSCLISVPLEDAMDTS